MHSVQIAWHAQVVPVTFARVSRSTPLVALGPRVFRKELLRVGVWSHPDAPDGRLEITRSMFDKIRENFSARVRDDVPVPLGHSLDALENAGHVVGLEAEGDRLFGLIEFKDEGVAEDVAAGKITGGSALLNLNHVDMESGKEHGPTLVHWALTNAPYIKGLAPYEAVALGEEASEAVFIPLDEGKEDRVDPIQAALEALKDASDEDIRKALEEHRPEVLKAEGSEEESTDLEAAKAEAAETAREEVLASLAERGIKVELSETGKGKHETKVDVSGSEAVVKLSEALEEIQRERAQEKAEAAVDAAIQKGLVLPAQKEALITVALSEGGMETFKALLPDKPVVDLSEIGVTPTNETTALSEEDAEAEADRYVSAYLPSGKES